MRRDFPSPSPSRFCFLTFLVKVKVNNSGRFYDDFVAVMEGFEQTVEVNWVPVICLYVSRAQHIDRIVLRIALSVFARAPHPLFKTTTSQLGSDVHIVVVGTFTLLGLSIPTCHLCPAGLLQSLPILLIDVQMRTLDVFNNHDDNPGNIWFSPNLILL